MLVLETVIAWWAARMLECVPERWRHFGGAGRSELIVSVVDMTAPMAVTVLHDKHGLESEAGGFLLDDRGRFENQGYVPTAQQRTARLRLPAACLLERMVVMPGAASRDMAGVLGWEMDRITPFKTEEVFWQFAIESRAPASDRLNVRLSLVPKAPWQPMLTALAQAGIAITTIEVQRKGGGVCRIDIDQDVSRRAKWERRWVLGVASVYGAVALMTIVLPFILQAVALRSVDRQIAALRPDAMKAAHLRDQIADSTSGIDVFKAEQVRTGDTLALVTAITESLPDDTYLSSLSLRQGQVEMTGYSAVAAKLIGALSNEKLIRNVAFAAPTMRARQASADLFSIHAEIASAGGAARSAPLQ